MPILTGSNIYFGKKKKKRWARVAEEVQDHIIHRALVKIPSDLICIIESIRRRPGAEEDLCMPVILQLLLLACLSECHLASFQTLSEWRFFFLIAFLSHQLNYSVIITWKILITLIVKILIPFIILGVRPTSTPGPESDGERLIKKRASFALQTSCELHTPPLLQIAIKSKAKHKGKGIIAIRANERRQPEWMLPNFDNALAHVLCRV